MAKDLVRRDPKTSEKKQDRQEKSHGWFTNSISVGHGSHTQKEFILQKMAICRQELLIKWLGYIKLL